jgi:hypothetical protein
MLGLLQQQLKSRVKSRVSSNWGKHKTDGADKLLNFPALLSRKWECCELEQCEGGLYGNKEYETCRAVSRQWLPNQTRGEFGISNKGRAANNSRQTAVITSSDVSSLVFYLN